MSKSISRRGFLKSSAVAAATVGFPTIVPSTVFGANAPSNRIVMGAIGLGSNGTGGLRSFLNDRRVQVVGVCDVDKNHRDRAKKITDDKYGNSDCKSYLDFRELIGRGDLDAMSLSVPDHWHALTAVASLRAGLDVYGQKPLARSIKEGRAIVDAVERHGSIWQTGSQQRSSDNFRHACELVRNGRIGKVHRVEVGLPRGKSGRVVKKIPVPEGLDWNFWLGPAPYRPFCDFGRGTCHWNWRWLMDYSGGQLTDWAGHHIDIAHWGLGLSRTGPVEIEGRGVYPKDGLYDVPTSYKFKCKYANGVELSVGDTSHFWQGAKWFGEKGWIFVSRGKLFSEPAGIVSDVIGAGELRLPLSGNHYANFIDSVKTRKDPIAPVEEGHRSISVGLLGEIAMLTQRKIKWNPDTEEIIDDPEAGRLLGRSYREPWSL